MTHVLGDVISPPIIGEISDRTGSLRAGMQVTWMMMFVAGAWWFFGYTCLSPLRVADERGSDAEAGEKAPSGGATFWSLLREDADVGSLSDVETSCDSALSGAGNTPGAGFSSEGS